MAAHGPSCGCNFCRQDFRTYSDRLAAFGPDFLEKACAGCGKVVDVERLSKSGRCSKCDPVGNTRKPAKRRTTEQVSAFEKGHVDGYVDATNGNTCDPRGRFIRWHAKLPESAWADYRAGYNASYDQVSEAQRAIGAGS